LEISILKATLPSDIFLESMLMAPEVILIQYLMFRPLIKPFWLGETILTIMEANMSAKIFWNDFKLEIRHNLKCFIEVAPWILRIREITLAFILERIQLWEKIFLQHYKHQSPQCLNNHGRKSLQSYQEQEHYQSWEQRQPFNLIIGRIPN